MPKTKQKRDASCYVRAMKREDYSSNRKGKREYLSKTLTKDMMKKLNYFFESIVEMPRVKHGNKQTLETLINEETLLVAQYLRNEKETWVPRIIVLEDYSYPQHSFGK